MLNPTVPGVSIEEINSFPPSIASVETAIPAFIGYTANHADLNPNMQGVVAPRRIQSFVDFEAIFGTPELETFTVNVNGDDEIVDSEGTEDGVTFSTNGSEASLFTLYYHMQLYFENGGGDCYIVSIGEADSTATPQLSKDQFINGLTEIRRIDEPTLLVFPEAAALDMGNHTQVITAAINQSAELQDRFTVASVTSSITATSASPSGEIADFRTALGNQNLRYGAIYYPNLVTTLSRVFDNSTVSITGGTFAGRTLEDVLNGVPSDATPPPSGGAAIPPDATLFAEITARVNALVNNIELTPDAATVGVYAAVDDSRGVWKAPANVSLRGVVAPSLLLSDADQGAFNVDPVGGKSINIIRSFTGRGTLIFGARTLDGNSNDFRYVNVRRLFNFVEESVQNAAVQFVFEPNVGQTWLRIKGAIDNFLTDLWRQGALAGARPQDAFQVTVGLGTTMSAQDILEGRLIVEIGLAPSRPAEFIILRFSQIQQVS